MTPRYIIRPDPRGFSVVDLTLGAPVVVGAEAQSGLSRADAEHMAGLLNHATQPADPSTAQGHP